MQGDKLTHTLLDDEVTVIGMYTKPIWLEHECLGDLTFTVLPPPILSMLDQTALYDARMHTSISKLFVSKF